MVFRDPQALSSTLTVLRSLQPRAFVSLNTTKPLVSLSNYYIYYKAIIYYSSNCFIRSVSQVRKATGCTCKEVCDKIDDVIADRISFGGECEARKITLWLTKIA